MLTRIESCLFQKLSNLDEQFFAELQGKQQRGELSKEEFSGLLQSYMNQMGDVKRDERKKRKAKLAKVYIQSSAFYTVIHLY